MSPSKDEAWLRPPSVWLALVAAGWLLDFILPLPFVPARYAPIASGGVVILIGLAVIALAFHEMRDFNAPMEDEAAIPTLVTGGVFRYSRNPVYIGMEIGMIGAAIALDSLWVLAMLIPFHAILAGWIVPAEERALERTFGDLYRDYCVDVRRWL